MCEHSAPEFFPAEAWTMDKHDPPRATDQTHHQAAGADHGHAHELRKDAGFNEIGDKSGNHAWAKMTGQPTGGADSGAYQAAGRDGGKAGHVDCGAHGDIYAPSGSKSNMASFCDAPSSSARQQELKAGGSDAGARPVSSLSEVPGGSDGARGQAGGKEGGGKYSAHRNSDGSEMGDRISDKPSMANAGDGNRPPEMNMPTPEQIKNAPVEQLQSMSRDNRQALDTYVQQQGDKIPTIATHGTDKDHGERLSQGLTTSNTEIWAAGQHPDRRKLGANQQVGDLSVATKYSLGFAEKRAQHGNGPGPVHVYDISNQPESFAKNKDAAHGGPLDGSRNSDVAKFANVDLNNAKLLGSVSRDQINQLNQKFAPLDAALQDKQKELFSQPGGPTPAQTKDLLDRVQLMYDTKANHEVRAVLDVVAQSRENEM